MLAQIDQPTQAQQEAFEALGAVLDAWSADRARLDALDFPTSAAASREHAEILEREAHRLDEGGEVLEAWRALFREYGGPPPPAVMGAAAERFLSRLVRIPAEGAAR
jgi:hypothetical protein